MTSEAGTNSGVARGSRFALLRSYLERDPNNLSLIVDAANAAYEEGELDVAADLIARHKLLLELPLFLANLDGLVALRQGRIDDARAAFSALIDAGVTEPSIRFNLAWVHALRQEHEAALLLLDDEVVAVTERAAALKVQTLHHLGLIEDALVVGRGMVERFPGNDALLGALSVAAMDADDMGLTRHYAGMAKGGADALTSQGLLALNDDDPHTALGLFDRALAENPKAPRAWLGKGLCHVNVGNVAEGTAALTRGAEIFGDHLGSWIAIGWTQFISKDLKAARSTFEHALALDENFAETHGGLAILDLAEGDLEGAKRRSDVALRLDRECFGGMLARMLLQEAKGNAAAAQRIWERAMEVPAGPDGKTLAQSLISFGLDTRTGFGRKK